MTSPSELSADSSKSGATSPARYAAIIPVVILIGAIVAWAGSSGTTTAGGIGVHWWVAAAAFAINWVAFVPSYLRRTEHYYDLVGSVTYLGTTALAVILSRPTEARSWMLLALVVVWAGRLGLFLFRRVKASGKDGRFDQIKQSAPRFLLAWTTQGLWVIFTAAAAHAAIATADPESLGPWAVIGLAVWILGFGVEATADAQKNAFRDDPANEGRFITSGLWAWSRHPNYFGEIVLWVGVALIAFPVLSGWQYLTLLSPVFVFLLLTRVSGIPMLEQRADKRWGGEPEYEQYKKQTPVLVPRPPRAT